MQMLRKILLSSFLLLGQQAKSNRHPDDIGFSVDLNKALLGIVVHGKAALGNTGIQIIDSFFNNDLQVDQSAMQTYEYTKWWYEHHHVGSQYITSACEEMKQKFYLQKIGWKANPAYDYSFQRNAALESATYYIGTGSKNNRFNYKKVDFSCTDHQRKIFMRAKLFSQFGYLKKEDQQ